MALGRDPMLEAHSDLEERREAHAKVVSVAVALDDYEAAVTMNTVKAASRRKRVRVLRRALEGFEARAVASIGRGELLKRLDTIQSDAGDVSRNRAQSELRHFLGWCREREIIDTIALDRVRRGVREVARDRVLSDDELKALLLATNDEWIFSALVRVLLYTAMRRNEAASLQARDLDFDARTITVRAEVSKTRVARTIPMASPIVEMLFARAQGLAHEDHVFGDSTSFKSPFSGFSKAFAKLWSRLPEGTKPWSLHDIRRTGATRMCIEGVAASTPSPSIRWWSRICSGISPAFEAEWPEFTIARRQSNGSGLRWRLGAPLLLRLCAMTARRRRCRDERVNRANVSALSKTRRRFRAVGARRRPVLAMGFLRRRGAPHSSDDPRAVSRLAVRA